MSSDISIIKVRSEICALYAKQPDLYDEIDLKRVNEDEKYVQRFLSTNNQNVDGAVIQIEETMQWRKSYGVNRMKRSDFPREFFMMGELFPYTTDKDGILTLYCRVNVHRAVSEWKDEVRRFVVYQIEQIEQRAKEEDTAWGLVVDCRNGRIVDVELDLDYYVIKILTKFYPNAMEYINVLDVPIVLWAVIRLIQSWLPEYYKQRMVFLNKRQLHDKVGTENLPDFMEGTCTMPYCVFYQDCYPFEQFVKMHNMNCSALKQVLRKYQPLLVDAERLIGKSRNDDIELS